MEYNEGNLAQFTYLNYYLLNQAMPFIRADVELRIFTITRQVVGCMVGCEKHKKKKPLVISGLVIISGGEGGILQTAALTQ